MIATLEDFPSFTNDGVVTRLHTTFHKLADSTDCSLSKICCYNGFTPSQVSGFAHSRLSSISALQARSILGAGLYTVTTFISGFGKHLLGLQSLPSRCNGLSLLGLVICFTSTVLVCYMWLHRATSSISLPNKSHCVTNPE